jgi:hypothetical protein
MLRKVWHTLQKLRIVAVPPDLTLGLGQDCDTNKFHIVTWRGAVEMSPPYRSREVAEVLFREKADELTTPVKEELAQRMLKVPYEEMTVEQKLQAADDGLEYMRLKAADDDETDALHDKAVEFCATHTKEEIEANIQFNLAEYNRQNSAEAE